MIVRFWGTRGSIASPGPDTVKYGGNTTCIEVRPDDGSVIILDAGTGIRPLGLELMKSMPVNAHVFISHTHWDHIQGLPFFVPLFVPGCRVSFYGTFDPVYQRGLADILQAQMEYCYFPVREVELNAEISYRSLKDSEVIEVGGARVSTVLMNHPVLTFGYVIEADGQKVFFTGDHEPPVNIYEPDDEDYEEYEQILALKNESIDRNLTDADLVIADAMYTEEEYPTKVGWGHGTHGTCFDMARRVGAKRVVMTHHEPVRVDEQLDAIEARLQAARVDGDPEVLVAREGMTIDLGSGG
jgi:phosphoribosyl 1,2-cyclic phosphodiesterase